MQLDTQTTIFMICFVYLMLHGGIWLALQEYRSYQVKLWCASGLLSGVAVVLLAMRGSIPEFAFMYLAQLLMLLGTWGRMVALRMYLPGPHERVFLNYKIISASYFFVFCFLIYFYQAEWEALVIFNGFYAFFCFEYFRIGLKLNQLQESLGAKLLIWAGLTFSATLAVRAVGVGMAGTIDDIYTASPHQAVMVIGQFIAITLSNIAFLRIFLEIAERKKIAAAHELAVTNERADAMLMNSLNLKNMMGALVASLAHELNQPLAVIQMNTEMLDLVLSEKDDRPQNRESLHVALSGLKKANVRASTVVSTLRDMFGNGRKADSNFDVNQIVKDVLLLCESAIHKNSIDVEIELHPGPLIFNGDKSQFQQVVLNLITNANEAISQDFSRRRNISIATQQLDNQILLKVSDSGSGIAPEIQANMFELFRSDKINGMGIGLWLSKAIVELHNGSIEFETSSKLGTCFTVMLPVTKVSSPR
ncbi:MAG: Sensor histidine kinase TmoS [Pseudomonadota bacterium]